MASILLLATGPPGAPGPDAPGTVDDVLPALTLLLHDVSVLPASRLALLEAPPSDLILLDARSGLVAARSLCRLLRAAGSGSPPMAVNTEAAITALTADWGLDDVVRCTAGPAEVEARIRLGLGRRSAPSRASAPAPDGPLVIDADGYTATLRGRPLDLTFKEFELLKYLSQHPGRVFTRGQLLQEVWGYDYYGGTRTVDVHVRRLRAKLGAEHESLIGTIRNVGYRFEAPTGRGSAPRNEEET